MGVAMAFQKKQMNLSKHLVESLEILAEQFELAPAEMLRIGAMDPLKLLPIGHSTEERISFELSWPLSLQQRIDQCAARAGCSLEFMVEHILSSMVQGFPAHFPCPIRDNPSGLDRLKRHLANLTWW